MSDVDFGRTLADFAAAVTAGDEAAARAASAAEAWHFGGETPRELFRQAEGRRGFTLEVAGEVTVVGDKAWGVCGLRARVKDGDEGPGRSLGRVKLMMEPAGVVGVAKDAAVVEAWLGSMITASARMASLPVSELGQAWSERVRAAAVAGGDLAAAIGDAGEVAAMAAMMLREVLRQPGGIVATLPSRWVPRAGRIGAGFLVTTPSDDLGSEVWVVLQATPSGGVSVVGTSAHVSLPLLLQGARPMADAPRPVGGGGSAAPAVVSDDPFEAAVAAARGEAVAATAKPGAEARGGDGLAGGAGPAPLSEHPDVKDALQGSIQQILEGIQAGTGPGDLSALKERASRALREALAVATRTKGPPPGSE